MITEAQHDKLRYLEEVHSAQRKVNDLQTHLKVLDSKVAEKEAEIRILQEKKSKRFLFFFVGRDFEFRIFSISIYSLWLIIRFVQQFRFESIELQFTGLI